MSNRVEDLESQVAELQATIDGLTEELVETKERVRELEQTAEKTDAIEATPGTGYQSQKRTKTTAEQQAEARGTDERRDAQFVENRKPAAEEPAEPEEPAPEATPEAETEADPEPEEADDDDDDDGIIVA